MLFCPQQNGRDNDDGAAVGNGGGRAHGSSAVVDGALLPFSIAVGTYFSDQQERVLGRSRQSRGVGNVTLVGTHNPPLSELVMDVEFSLNKNCNVAIYKRSKLALARFVGVQARLELQQQA